MPGENVLNVKGVCMRKGMILILSGILCWSHAVAEKLPFSALKAMGAPNNPRVEIAWNRYYDYQGISRICHKLSKAFPELIKVKSLGESVQGKDIIIMTVTDFSKGDPLRKPAMYIDGNIHSNEIQGAEVVLYTAWYLAENSGHVNWIDTLLENKVFYLVPTINPDARDFFIHQANTPHSPRTGMLPRDDDGDGMYDEDFFDDLDGDGNIVMMRKRDEAGRWKNDPDDPRMMVRCREDEPGQFIYLGWEGIDNDNDGLMNEDGPGYYDPNRNWAWFWQPSYVQSGADQYPFSIPENRLVADFILTHPHICGAQTYHNAGGMILRGPGEKSDTSYRKDDIKVYDIIGRRGEEMLPGYRYMVLFKDLYTVWGSEIDWLYGARGIYTFTNELWTPFDYFRKHKDKSLHLRNSKKVYRFDELFLFGEGIVDWKEYDHPQYGRIEIGGINKAWTRTAPSFLIEDMCHRNMAFTLYHAYHLPLLDIDSVSVSRAGRDVYQVDIRVRNTRVIPTRSSHEIHSHATVPDYAVLRPEKGSVIAGFIVDDPFLNRVREQEHRPERLKIESVPGMGVVYVRYLVSTCSRCVFSYDSQKGGIYSKEISLK